MTEIPTTCLWPGHKSESLVTTPGESCTVSRSCRNPILVWSNTSKSDCEKGMVYIAISLLNEDSKNIMEDNKEENGK